MKAQTRIFSVATTIACFAMASPGFAQTYIGGSSQPMVQVDLGALDALPGPAQGTATPAHHRGKKTNKSANPDTGDYQTTIIGGGGDTLAPITILHTGHHIKPAPRKAKPVMSADELNAMQLSSQKAILPNTAPSIPQASVSAMPLDNAPSLPSNSATPAQPFDRPPVPPALPEEHVAGLPPTRDDYDERRKQRPALPTEPLLPPAGPAPEETNGAQKTTFIVPKLPPNTPVTTDALNRAELNQILVQNGLEPLPPLAPAIAETKPASKHRAKTSAPAPKQRPQTRTANASAPKPAKAPVVEAKAEAAPAPSEAMPLDQPPALPSAPPPPPPMVKAKAPAAKTTSAQPAPKAQAPLTAESLNRQELAKLSSTGDQTVSAPPVSEAPPAPMVEQTKIAPPPPVVAPVSPPPAPMQRAASIAPPPPVIPAPPPPPAPVAPKVVLPPPTKAPASTPEDLIDEGPQPYQPRTRIITDPNSPQAVSPTPANFSVGHYDIPSDIQVNGNQQPAPIAKTPLAPVQPVIAPAPIPQAPAPSVAPVAPQTEPVVQASEATPLDQTPIVATQPVPAPLPKPPTTVPKQNLAKAQDTTQALNQTELSKSVTAMPLDQPPAAVTASAPVAQKMDTLPVPPASIVPAPVSASMTKPGSSDDLAVTFTPGSTSLSQETTARLDMLVGHLKQNPDLRVELRSLASANKETTSKARRTSLARALAIKSYLQSQGIAEDHIDVRALGAPPGQPPADRVDFFLMR